MNHLRFAIIGCGRMGRHHAQKLITDGRGQVVALMDAHQETAKSLQAEFCPDAQLAASLSELVRIEAIDAAIICTPTAEHYRQSVACLDRGWHLLCEKPLASTRDEILELIQRAEQARSAGQAVGSPPSRTATTELVVPKSIPTALAIAGASCCWVRRRGSPASGGSSQVESGRRNFAQCNLRNLGSIPA